MATLEPTPPVPPRTRSSSSPLRSRSRQALADSFEGFEASTVSQDHIDRAMACIESGEPVATRYEIIDFTGNLHRNREKGNQDYLTMMTSAYDLLLKYVVNLLKKKRPQVWRSIKTNNTAFKARVACMEGAYDILTQVGYSITSENAIQFPQAVASPDRPRLYQIAADLLMAKLEVEKINKKQAPSPPRARSSSASQRLDLQESSGFTLSAINSRPGRQQLPENNSFAVQDSTPPIRDQYPSISNFRQSLNPPSPQNASQMSTSREPQTLQQRYSSQPEQTQQNHVQQPPYNAQVPSHSSSQTSTSYQQASPQPHSAQRQHQTEIVPPSSTPGVHFNGGVKSSASQEPTSQPKPVRPSHTSTDSQGSSGVYTEGGSSSGSSPFSSIGEQTPPQPSSMEQEGNAVSAATDFLARLRRGRRNIKAELTRNIRSEYAAPSMGIDSEKKRREEKAVTQPFKPKPSPINQDAPPLPPKTYKEGESPHHVGGGDMSQSGSQIRKPPGPVHHPRFEDDPIIRASSTSDTSHDLLGYPRQDLHQGQGGVYMGLGLHHTDEESQVAQVPSIFCKRCNNRISPGETMCNYCGVNGTFMESQPPADHTTIPGPEAPAIPPKNSFAMQGKGPKVEPFANYQPQPYTPEHQPAIPPKMPKIDENPEPQPPPPAVQKVPATTVGPAETQHPAIPHKSPRVQRNQPPLYEGPIIRASAEDAKAAEDRHQKTIMHVLRTEPFTPQEPSSFATVPKPSPVRPVQQLESVQPDPFTTSAVPNRSPAGPTPASGNVDSYVKFPRRENQYEPSPPTLPPKPPREQPAMNTSYPDDPKPKPRMLPSSEDPYPNKPVPRPRSREPPARQKPPAPDPEAEIPPKVPPRPSANQGAKQSSGQATGSSSQGAVGSGDTKAFGENTSYIKTLEAKEKAWKDHQLRQGVKEEDIEVLPERVEFERKREAERRRKDMEMVELKKKKKLEAEQFPRINTRDMQYEYDHTHEQKMQVMVTDGTHLLESVKECHRHGYSLEEIEIAFAHCTDRAMTPLSFLQNEWVRQIHNVQAKVPLCRKSGDPDVGFPSIEEAKKFLVEANGEFFTALKANYNDRKNKISELCEKVARLKTLKPDLGELTWDAAIQALSRNKMDVTAAYHAVQCEWLQDVHEYIFSEYKEVVQTEYENIKKLVKNDDLDIEFRYRVLMGECDLNSMERSARALKLLEKAEQNRERDVPLNYCVEAARDYDDLEKAEYFLIKECPICFETTSVHEMVQMPGCTCTMCKDCFKRNFEVVIKEKSVKHFRCPTCSEPDIANLDEQSFYTEMFTGLIKEHLDKECYDQCQKKLNEFKLTKDPGFRWCVSDKCREGFIVDRRNPHPDSGLEVACPSKDCNTRMCFNCKTEWDPWHQGQTCEAFAQWKRDNNPEAQEQGLAAHLKANGIECPHCHMRYDLARGGCMHFKCTQCPNEFCSGCGESFRNKMDCGRYESCARMGFHAHHPRDCLFYLRDFSVKKLQEFLKAHNIPYDVDTPPEQLQAARRAAIEDKGAPVADVKESGAKAGDGEAAAEAPKGQLKCCVMLQKETQEGLKDEECGKIVVDGNAGLCDVHYKEYLVDKINKNKLDPVTIYETGQIGQMLRRDELEVPEKEEDESDEQHRQRVIEEVQQKLPLTFKTVQPKGGTVPPGAGAAAVGVAAAPGRAAGQMVVENVEGEG